MSKPDAYPYLIVRIYSAVYQREEIDIRIGPSDVQIGFRSSYVQHPQPLDEDHQPTSACRELLVSGVLEAVQRLNFRMCLVWGPNDCTYCEKGGSAKSSHTVPSGGLGSAGEVPLPFDITFDRRERYNISEGKPEETDADVVLAALPRNEAVSLHVDDPQLPDIALVAMPRNEVVSSQDINGSQQQQRLATADRQMHQKFVRQMNEGKKLEEMDADVFWWWWNR